MAAAVALADHAYVTGDVCAAIRTYEQLLVERRGDGTAYTRLEAIYRERQQWADLIRVALLRVERLGSVADQVALLWEVAGLYETRLSDLTAALDVMETAFVKDCANEHTERELVRLANARHARVEDPTSRKMAIEPDDCVDVAPTLEALRRRPDSHPARTPMQLVVPAASPTSTAETE